MRKREYNVQALRKEIFVITDRMKHISKTKEKKGKIERNVSQAIHDKKKALQCKRQQTRSNKMLIKNQTEANADRELVM